MPKIIILPESFFPRKFLPIKYSDWVDVVSSFVDAKIEVLNAKWWEVEVADIDLHSKDKNNPYFYVYYELQESGDDIIEKKSSLSL